MNDKERIEILKKVKQDIKDGTSSFICNAINNELMYRHGYREFGGRGMDREINRVLRIFPELKKHRPKEETVHSGAGWWNEDYEKPRIIALTSMIKEIKAKSNA